MTPQRPHYSPEKVDAPQPWKPWVLDRMIRPPGRPVLGASWLSFPRWLLATAALVVLVGAYALLFWQGAGGPGDRSTLVEMTPLPTVQRSGPTSNPLTETPLAPPASSRVTVRPSAVSSRVPASTATRAPQPKTAPSKYKVKAGDTLLGIALKYGVTVDALKQANRLTSDMLHIGDELIIPNPP